MIRNFFVYFLLLAFSQTLRAQSAYAPLNSEYYHLIERQEVLAGRLHQDFHSHIKPYQRHKIAEFIADNQKDSSLMLSKVDKFNLAYLAEDNWEFLKRDTSKVDKFLQNFYRQKADFYQHQSKDFDLHLNPVFYGSVGKDNNSDKLTFLNSRGVEIRGRISDKVAFYTFFTDNQATFPKYVQNRIQATDALPGEAYYKDGDTAEPTNVDFIHARGYINFNITKNINLQFGHDRNSIGAGYRSMILSDFSPNYLFLKLNTNVWKLNYQNIFAQMTAEVLNADGLRPKKYMAMHHLSLNVSKNFNIGLFETIIFGARDTLSNNTFDLNYLNPIIFYRSVEQNLGSPDNALLGMDFKWLFARKFMLYGQLVLDEFLLKEVRANEGWWANKFAAQIGLKYINAFKINNLDLQAEFNVARPYTYTQENNFKSYANYQQPLAHPLGANFYEFVGLIRYQPFNRLNLTAKLMWNNQGLDENGLNWGGNLLLDNRTRVQEYGNTIGQGLANKTLFADFTASYQFWHNAFIDFKQVLRNQENSSQMLYKNTTYTALSLRLNIGQRLHEF
ncbi:MAG: hypothetical protein SFU27_01920 [Thermonemataceae bacterium]|nr:hypothetical protein [Thermonemataceae bacterium]